MIWVLALMLIVAEGTHAVCVINQDNAIERPGIDVFLDCSCTNVEATTYNISWCLESTCATPLENGGDYGLTVDRSDPSAVVSSLQILSAQVDDTSTYYCQGNGVIVAQTDLTVKDVPIARIVPRDASITNGQNTTLTCRLTNSIDDVLNEPVVWKKNGVVIGEHLDGDGKMDVNLAGTELTIIDGDASDGGLYVCGQYNRSLEVESQIDLQTRIELSSDIKLNVKDGTTISAQINCSAKGYPYASVQWGGSVGDLQGISSQNANLSTVTSSLEISNKNFEDKITCTASNILGSSTTSFEINIDSSGCSIELSRWSFSAFLILYICVKYILNV
ncbi:uncharacterized protein [Antedon mediterranea]|uniref:uncharacterized protein n=1 Tax=Antedon mediterranea TaxID=105859 RepID=UPI003AF8A5FE